MQDLFSYIKCRRILQPDIIIRIKKGDKKRCSQRRKNKKIDSMVANDVKTFLKNKLWWCIEKLL